MEEARQCINNCVELRPGFAQTLSVEGKFQMNAGNYDAAIWLFEKTLKSIPFFNDSVYSLFNIYYFNKRDLHKVNALINGFKETQPLNPMVAFFYLFVFSAQEESPLIGIQEIEENFQASIEMEPEVYSYSIYQMGLYLSNNKFKECKAIFNVLTALEDQPPALKDLLDGVERKIETGIEKEKGFS